MGLLASAKQREWQLPPPGMYAAVCVDVEDHGMVMNQKWGKEQHECRFVWQINARMDDGRLFTVNRKFTVSLSEKSHLLPFLQGWFGRPLTTEELNSLDLERLVGVQAMVQVLHNPSKDGQKTYANVTQIMPLAPGMQPVTPESYTRLKDREPQPQQGQATPQTQRYEQAPNRQQQYQQQQGQGHPQQTSPPMPPRQGQGQQGGPYAATPQPVNNAYDPRIDDIPF